MLGASFKYLWLLRSTRGLGLMAEVLDVVSKAPASGLDTPFAMLGECVQIVVYLYASLRLYLCTGHRI